MHHQIGANLALICVALILTNRGISLISQAFLFKDNYRDAQPRHHLRQVSLRLRHRPDRPGPRRARRQGCPVQDEAGQRLYILLETLSGRGQAKMEGVNTLPTSSQLRHAVHIRVCRLNDQDISNTTNVL